MRRGSLRDLFTCIICGIFVLNLISLPSIIRSSCINPTLYLQAFAQQPSATAQGKKPNVLMIVGADFGWYNIGAFGSQISTPNLDALAKDGKILTN